jgi:hypothetical protein
LEVKMMRSTLILAIILAVAISAVATGEVEKKDEAAIRQAALDYAEGFYEGSAERLVRAFHPNMQKVCIQTFSNGRNVLDFNGTSANLQEYVGTGRSLKPAGERGITVTIFEVFGDIATVKIDTVDFNDYAHLARINGEWKIVNILSARHPEETETEKAGKPAPVKSD